MILFPRLSFAEECKTLDGSVAKKFEGKNFILSRDGDKYIVSIDGSETQIPKTINAAFFVSNGFLEGRDNIGWRLYDANLKPIMEKHSFNPILMFQDKKYAKLDFTIENPQKSIWIDGCGKEIFPKKIVKYVGNDKFAVQKNGKWGLTTVNGKMLIPPKYDYAFYYFDFGIKKIAIVLSGKKYGAIYEDGKIAIPFIYDLLEYNVESKYIEARIGDIFSLLDENFHPLFKPSKRHIINYSNADKFYELERVKSKDSGRWINHYHLLDTNGDILKRDAFVSGFADYEIKYIGKYDSEPIFEQNGLVNALSKDGRKIYLDYKGDVVIPADYQCVRYFNNLGVASFKQNGKWGLLDSKNTKITEPKYDFIGFTVFGLENFRFKQNGKWGILNSKGEEIIGAQYENIGYIDNRYFSFEKNGKLGIIGTDNKAYIQNIYDAFKFDNSASEECYIAAESF